MPEKNYKSSTSMIRATGPPSSGQINSPRSLVPLLNVAQLYRKLMIASGISTCEISGELRFLLLQTDV